MDNTSLKTKQYARPWIKMKRYGVASLDEAELLSMLLSRHSKDPLELAYALIDTFSLDLLLTLSPDELKPITQNTMKAYQIVALGELFKRYSRIKRKGFTKQITSPEDVFRIFADEFSMKKQEHFYVLLLDTKNRIINKSLVSVGTLNASLIHPREVFREAIRQAAHGVIAVHNHPSGDPSPSAEDRYITDALKKAGEIINIRFLDHVIIGDESYYAFSSSDTFFPVSSKNVK